MLTRRIIPCLDVRQGRVVKGVRFLEITDQGDPVALGCAYEEQGADELCMLDITATIEGRLAFLETVRALGRELAIPLTVGGGVRTAEDMRRLLEAGADKVAVNSAAVRDPEVLASAAERFGRQCVVLAIDARRIAEGEGEREGEAEGEEVGEPAERRFEVVIDGGRTPTGHDAVPWAQDAVRLGAGEILLTSMDRDGTREGFDLALTRTVARAVTVPVIASGGAGLEESFWEVLTAGEADAALAASIFHRGERTVRELKRYLADRGVPMRL